MTSKKSNKSKFYFKHGKGTYISKSGIVYPGSLKRLRKENNIKTKAKYKMISYKSKAQQHGY